MFQRSREEDARRLTTRLGVRVLCITALVLGAAVCGEAKGGVKYGALFDDTAGHDIRSDGGGAYDASLPSRTRPLTISTGGRSLYLDFSDLLSGPGDTPFNGAPTGWISGVKMDIGHMEFTAPAPDGSGNTTWWLYLGGSEQQYDDDGNGETDRWELSGTADVLLWWDASQQQGPGHRGGKDPAGGWTEAGRYQLPWAVTVEPK